MTTSQSVGDLYRRDGFLRAALRLDAVASGAVGVFLLVASSFLDGLLGTPLAFHVSVGLFLLVYAISVFGISTRREISRAAAWIVVDFNILWMLASVVIVVSRVFDLTALGVAFMLFQGAVVGLFGVLQFYGLRKSG